MKIKTLIIALALVIPSVHAMASIFDEERSEAVVNSVDVSECTIEAGKVLYNAQDCDTVKDFKPGDFILIIKSEKAIVLRAENGNETFVDEA
jgi:hypothetical protein